MSLRATRGLVAAVIAVVAIGGVVLAVRPGSAAAAGDVSITVVNGFYGSNLSSVPIDVCVDDVELVTNLASGGVIDVLAPSGSVAIRVAAHQAGVACASKATVFIDQTANVSDGSIVFPHNGANDVGGAQPELAVPPFPCSGTSEATLASINGANTGSVDVRVNGAAAIAGLPNGGGALAYPPAGPAPLAVVPTGGGATLASDPAVPFALGQVRFVFLVGGVGATPADRAFGLVEFTRTARACAPPTTGTTATTQATTSSSTSSTSVPAAVAPVVTPAFTG